MSVIEAKRQMRDLGTKAQAVVDDSTLSAAEKMKKLDDYEVDLKKFSDEVAVYEQAQRISAAGESEPSQRDVDPSTINAKTATKTIGRRIIESDAYIKALSAAKSKSEFKTFAEIATKANTVDEGITIVNGQPSGAAGPLVLPDYQPGIVGINYAPLSVAQLFAQGSTGSSIVSYVKEATETQGAAARAEKTTAGQSDATFVRVNEQVGQITGLFKITDEMLQDAEQAESFISARLIAQVQREEENESLNGTGYPALAGVLGRAGVQAAISAGTTGTLANPMKLAEAIHNQRTKIRTTAFVEPDAVVMNPTDWEYIQLAKDLNGQYFQGGPFSGGYGNGGYTNIESLWGLRVVLSPRIASGTALVGGFQECAQLFRRQGITVEMTNSNEDDFKTGLVAVRATSRSALAVYRPGGFGTVTITWA
jgi:HK97 family phage major capsid protein